jgi:hypothetical protein
MRSSNFLTGAGAAAVGFGLFRGFVAPRLASWGATPEEVDLRLPGDELVPDPATSTTRAISIDAPPAAVWPWLVQIGSDRGGWYTYDALERLAGVPVHNTTEIRDEWQHLAVGDRVQLAPPGWLGTPGMVLPVVRVDEGRALVLRQQPPDSPWDGVWSFHLRPAGGSTRLLIRSRSAVPEGPARALATAVSPIIDPVTWLMERGMLRGLRDRSERAAAPAREG